MLLSSNNNITFKSATDILGIKEEKSEESVAKEVMEYREKLRLKKIIKKSAKVHSERPFILKFRVGQVVQHISEGYKGVIIEWEPHSVSDNLSFNIIYQIVDSPAILEGGCMFLYQTAVDAHHIPSYIYTHKMQFIVGKYILILYLITI